MGTYTGNYRFYKPGYDEAADIGKINENMDRLDAVLTGVSNPNLLDNWYFADPINQRGQVEYSGVGYNIDRWAEDWNYPGKISIEEGGILLHAGSSLVQLVESPAFDGATATFSVFTADNKFGAVTFKLKEFPQGSGLGDTQLCFFSVDYMPVCLRNPGQSDVKVKAAKLELGTQQTLACQDASGNWVLNDSPPNKALELAKCQRYQIVFSKHNVIPYGAASIYGRTEYDGSLSLFIPTPVELRENPAIIGDTLSVVGGHAVVQFPSLNTTGKKDRNGIAFTIPGDFSSIGIMEAVSVNTANLVIDANL